LRIDGSPERSLINSFAAPAGKPQNK
jgi:hypothetical protein